MSAHDTPLTVLGAGAWGTALAARAAHAGAPVRLWGRDAGTIAAINHQRRNPTYLPDVQLPEGITGYASASEALAGVHDVLLAGPTSAFNELLAFVAEHVTHPRVVWACKGLERETGRFLSDVVAERLGAQVPCAIISGPTFAAEVARGLPTAVVVAANDEGFAASLTARLHQPCFRVYESDDIAGVQLGGAAKNVFAIAAGIADGLGFGANARAALIARGLAEMARLAEHCGGRAETLMGLAGMGDLVLTCTDDQSRNRRYGLALGRGMDAKAALAETGKVVEGMLACRDFSALAQKWSLDLPIMAQVNQVVWHAVAPRDAVGELLARAPTRE